MITREPRHRFVGSTLRALRESAGVSLRELARRIGVSAGYLSQVESGQSGPPTPERLFQIAAENGKSGEYIALIQKIQAVAEEKSGKMLPINATGAIGAICCEFGFPWKIVRGFGVMARAIGLVGHILEESENPISYELWQRAEEEILETSGRGAT